jgi:asparagine synthase (glutamine-hydrolysing)
MDGRPADGARVRSMLQTLVHRGPDGCEVHLDASAGLGHALLHTTPESLLEHQPLVSRPGHCVLTADARIDNRSELISALVLRAPASEITDADLILAAYERWGADAPEKLIGDFAFAIWDANRQELFCARDHMGIKPFYYSFLPGRLFAFGSEIKSLLVLEEIPDEIDLLRIGYYLVGCAEDKERTFYQGIFRLPPAHTLTVTAQGITLRQYWSLNPEQEIRLESDDAYAEAFLDVFTEAVRCRLRSAFPVGMALSGGLDSSSVACVARNLLTTENRGPLHTFSSVFPGLPEEERAVNDEQEYIDAVLTQGGFAPHFIPADGLSPLQDLGRVLWHQDQPFEMRNVYLGWSRYEKAQQEGIRVMLDGVEGDNTVSHGKAYLAELARSGRWKDFAREAHALSATLGGSPDLFFQQYGMPLIAEAAWKNQWGTLARHIRGAAGSFDVSAADVIKDYVLKPRVPRPAQRLWSRLQRSSADTPGRTVGIIHRDFVRQIDLRRHLQYVNKAVDRVVRAQYSKQREEHWLSLGLGLHTVLLESGDKNASAFSIEQRHPFYDRRLMELCLALPATQKLRNGWTRAVLRHAMRDIIPQKIVYRASKATLSPNFFRNLLSLEKARLESLPVSPHIAPYVNIGQIEEALRREDLELLWPALVLNEWLDKRSATCRSAA